MVASMVNRYWRAAGWLAAAFVPVLAARGLSEVVVASPLVVALILLLVWFGSFVIAVRGLWTESNRERTWKSLSRFGRAAPLVYAVVLAELAIVLFATLAFVLADRELIRFGTGASRPPALGGPADLLGFFAWHLLDAVPALDLTTTLRWDEPLGYDDSWVGALVLVFDLIVIAPILAAFVSFWRYRRQSTVNRPPGGRDRA